MWELCWWRWSKVGSGWGEDLVINISYFESGFCHQTFMYTIGFLWQNKEWCWFCPNINNSISILEHLVRECFFLWFLEGKFWWLLLLRIHLKEVMKVNARKSSKKQVLLHYKIVIIFHYNIVQAIELFMHHNWYFLFLHNKVITLNWYWLID